MATYTCLSVCSGLGLLDHGVNLAIGGSLEPVLFVEREAFAAANLAWQMEQGFLAQAPIWSDLKQLPRDYLRQIKGLDFFIGGIPCQPWSAAGKQLGADDERDLWPASAEAIGEYKPRIVFIENVSGFASEPMGLHRVGRELEGMGYKVAAGLFSSAECGASHQRVRCFVLGVLNGDQWGADGRESDTEPNGGRHVSGSSSTVANPERGIVHGSKAAGQGGTGRTSFEGSGRTMADPGGEDAQRRGKKNNSERRQVADGHVRLECRELPHYAPTRNDYRAWAIVAGLDPSRMPAIESEVRGMANGLASRAHQLRAIGNGVDPLVAAYAFVTLWACVFGGESK